MWERRKEQEHELARSSKEKVTDRSSRSNYAAHRRLSFFVSVLGYVVVCGRLLSLTGDKLSRLPDFRGRAQQTQVRLQTAQRRVGLGLAGAVIQVNHFLSEKESLERSRTSQSKANPKFQTSELLQSPNRKLHQVDLQVGI